MTTYAVSWLNKSPTLLNGLDPAYAADPTNSYVNGASQTTGYTVGTSYNGSNPYNNSVEWASASATPITLNDPGASQAVIAISDNGSCLLGWRDDGSGHQNPITWPASGTPYTVLTLPAGYVNAITPSAATNFTSRYISADGLTTFGNCTLNPYTGTAGVSWDTSTGTPTILAVDSLGFHLPTFVGMSADGATFLFYVLNTSTRWGGFYTSATPYLLIPYLAPDAYSPCDARFCTADGSVIFGTAGTGGATDYPCYWDSLATMTLIGTPPVQPTYGVLHILDVPAGGTPGKILYCAEQLVGGQPFCVGYAVDSGGNTVAAKWTGTTITTLDQLPGGTHAEANGTSADGSIIVGFARDGSAVDWPVYWDNTGIHKLIVAYGVSYPGYAYGITQDGTRIWGSADVTVPSAPGVPINLRCG